MAGRGGYDPGARPATNSKIGHVWHPVGASA